MRMAYQTLSGRNSMKRFSLCWVRWLVAAIKFVDMAPEVGNNGLFSVASGLRC